MRKMRWWAWTIATMLFAIQFVLMALIVRGESLTFDEGNHIYAGYMTWHAHDYGLNPEHPPLVKLVAILPFLGKPLWVPPYQDRFFKIEAYMNGRDFLLRNDGPGHLVFRAR